MGSGITAEHAAYNAQRLKESRADFETEYGFENPPTGDNGWIEPDGTLMANRYEDHAICCDLWYGSSEDEVEKTHVKLSDGVAHFHGKRITPRQMKTLFNYGYDSESLMDGGSTIRAGR